MNGLIIIMVFLLLLQTPELVLELVPYLSPSHWSAHITYLTGYLSRMSGNYSFHLILEGSP